MVYSDVGIYEGTRGLIEWTMTPKKPGDLKPPGLSNSNDVSF